MKKGTVLSLAFFFLLAGCGGSYETEKKLAVEYVNVFLRGDDAEAKKEFVEKHVQAEMQAFMHLAIGMNGDLSQVISDPEAVAAEKVKEGVAVLLRGKNGEGTVREQIVFFLDGKVVVAPGDEPDNDLFTELRAHFD